MAYTGTLTSGSDSLLGTNVNDTGTNTTTGNDTINGNDIANGAVNQADLISYLGLSGAITVTLSSFGNGSVVKAPGGTDSLVGIERVEGTTFNDSFTGSTGNDSYVGGAGNDAYNGGAHGGSASALGGPGDVLSYWNWGQVNLANAITYNATGVGAGSIVKTNGGGTDTIAGVELVQGTSHNDVFNGSNGNDSYYGSLGNDIYLGGAGNDFIGYSIPFALTSGNSGPTAIRVDMGAGIVDKMSSGTVVTTPNGGTDAIIGVVSLFGTAGNDLFMGGDPTHSVYGTSNTSETFGGGSGNDTLVGTQDGQYGGTVFVLANYSYVSATGIYVDLSTNGALISAGTDVDTFDHITGVFGTNQSDTLIGGGYYELPWGGRFDILAPQGGNDTAIGSDATYDRVMYNQSTANMTVDLTGWNTGGDGLVNNAFAGGEVDHLQGSIEQIYTGNGNDTILGSNRDESFIPQFGANSVNGGGGEDTIQYSNFMPVGSHGITVHLGGVGNQNGTVLHDDSPGGTLSVTDTIVGIEAAAGTHDADTFYAAGVEVTQEFEGLQGNDSMYGDSANGAFTFVDYHRTPEAVVVNLTTGVADDGYGFTDTLVDIQGVEGSMWDDSITGSAANEGFVGRAGADTIDGGLGNDTISYDQDAPGDEGSSAISGVVVILADTTMPGLGVDGWGFPDTIINMENVFGSHFNDIIQGNKVANDLEGRAGNDMLMGLNAVDTLVGGDGADTLDGGTSADSMVGGLGDDLYVVDVVNDKVKENAGEGDDTVALRMASGNYTLGANVEDVYVFGASTANVTGNSAANWMRGSNGDNGLSGAAGNDTLGGAKGNDIINGAGGKDLLSGGQGADAFQFGGTGVNALTLTAVNADTIVDFKSGVDHIDLDDTTFTAIGVANFTGGDARFYSGAGAKTAHDANDRMVYDTATGKLYYDSDGAGGTAAVLVATLQGHPMVTATDIHVI